jgi:hypothetical protein
VLVPGFRSDLSRVNNKQSSKLKKLRHQVSKQIGCENQFELYALVPITSEDQLQNLPDETEVAVRLTHSGKCHSNPDPIRVGLSLRTLEDMLECKEKTQIMMQKNNEALMQYVADLKNLRNLVLSDIGSVSSTNSDGLVGPPGQVLQHISGSTSQVAKQSNRENILKKALKCKQLEDDNKKLRKLLKTQIENSEQLRQDTQNTIETLREEFDVLVKELLQYKQKDERLAAA